MRQRSMADMAWSWPRLDARHGRSARRRHGDRKTLTTSRPQAAHAPPARLRLFGLAAAPAAGRSSGLVTADRSSWRRGCRKRYRLELGMAEQHLDDADVGVLFQQSGWRSFLPQRVQRHRFLRDPGGLSGGMDRRRLSLTGREPARSGLRPGNSQPPRRAIRRGADLCHHSTAQQLKQLPVDGMASQIFASFALLDQQRASLRVDIADLRAPITSERAQPQHRQAVAECRLPATAGPGARLDNRRLISSTLSTAGSQHQLRARPSAAGRRSAGG